MVIRENRMRAFGKSTDQHFLLLCLATVLLILITRGLSLTYHMDVHPDEEVFCFASDSLLKFLLYGTEFSEIKEYPEGAYIFHLPFQALGLLFEQLTDIYLEPRFWGRVSSVFYFTAAVLIGMRIEYQNLGKNLRSVIIYALSMVFSVFFIEHSRYGVGDMISLFLLMVVLDTTIKWCKNKETNRCLFMAAFLSGALGAVKYPQLYFLLIPVTTCCVVNKDRTKKTYLYIFGMILTCFLGLLVFSPKAMFDWSYFTKAISREIGAYVFTVGGGIHNTVVQLLVHHTLFLDFPFAAFFLGFSVIKFLGGHPVSCCRKRLQSASSEDVLLYLLLPAVTFGFLFYNLFITSFAMRTFTPYLGICLLYTAKIVSYMFGAGKWKKAFILFLTLFMILRGMCMVYLLSTRHMCEDFVATVANVIQEHDNRGRIITFRTSRIPHKQEIFKGKEIIKLEVQNFEEFNEYDIRIKEGDIVIVSALDYANGQKYPLPVLDESALNTYYAWEYFKEENQEYLVGRSTSGWPYYLFGSFIRGNSFAGFTYPRCYIYYHPVEE